MVRAWLPDRPGALGQVAGRIGAVGGDVVGIEILERGGGSAIDELTVTLPDGDSVDLLIAAIGQVDGVAVEDMRRVAADRLDHGTAALAVAEQLVGLPEPQRLSNFCVLLKELVDGDWAVAVDIELNTVLSGSSEAPDVGWLMAFLEGSRHLSTLGDSTPGDIVWTHVPNCGATVLSGRAGRVFHARERQQVDLLGRIVDAVSEVRVASDVGQAVSL